MRILHTSDLHGSYKPLLAALETADYDVWLDTGDHAPTKGRLWGARIDRQVEIRHQQKWGGYRTLGRRYKQALAGRPLISVGGNHDFVNIAAWVRQNGGHAYDITPEGFELLGHRWAGFREINYIVGEWAGETHDFGPIIDRLDLTADILVTHTPPSGILDSVHGYGVIPLNTFLFYRPNNVKHHFFGHCHEDGNKSVEHSGIHFHNGACHIRTVEI